MKCVPGKTTQASHLLLEMQVQLELVEQQAQMRLAQKTAELQLLQRRMRDEARATVEVETRRADGLKRQLEDRQAVPIFRSYLLFNILNLVLNFMLFERERQRRNWIPCVPSFDELPRQRCEKRMLDFEHNWRPAAQRRKKRRAEQRRPTCTPNTIEHRCIALLAH